MDQDRHAGEAVGALRHGPGCPVGGGRETILLGPGHAFDDRVDRLEMGGVRGQGDGELFAGTALEDAAGTLVVLHVTGALHGLGIQIPLELLEDLLVRLSDDVGQHVEPAPMRHPHHDLGHAGSGGGVQQGVKEHDRRLRPLQAESLLTHVAGVEEPFEDLRRIEAIKDVPLLFLVERAGLPLHMLLDPALLLGVLYVHVLDPERPAVGIPEHMEDLVQCGHVAAGQPIGHKAARQVPDGEPVGQRVQLGVNVRWFGIERVQMCDEVPTDPVHVDEGLHVHLLDQALVLPLLAAFAGVVVDLPAHRLVGHAHRFEERVVEAVRPGEEGRHPAQEDAGLGSLDDAVVVGRGQRHHLAQAQLGHDPRVGGLKAGWVPERADPDDGALPGHEPRHRLHRAEGSGIGQGHRGAGEVVG